MNRRSIARCVSKTAISFAVLLSICDLARAQAIPGYPDRIEALDPREVALLPKYCTYTQMFRERVAGGNDPPVIEGWYSRLGPTFHHMHHYCLGLMKMNRAMFLAPDQIGRRFYLNDSITEIDYVIERAPPDYVLMPEFLTKKASALILLGKGPVGVMLLERAIELRDDYWLPYAQLSDYYKDSGDPRKAREALERGLAKTPDVKALQRRLAELDSGAAQRGSKR